jgi:hypothetical protein
MGEAMSEPITLKQAIKEWAKGEGIEVKITPLDPADPPAPKSGMTGQQLADFFSPQPKPSGKDGKNGN